MKELDKTKKYGLSKLTDEQLSELLNWMKKNDIGWVNGNIQGLKTKPFIRYDSIEWNQYNGSNATCATELFEDEKGNVVTQYDRMMTEEEKELWLFVYKESVKDKQTIITHKEKADQAVKDFREALIM